jgi:hypothetical protein
MTIKKLTKKQIEKEIHEILALREVMYDRTKTLIDRIIGGNLQKVCERACCWKQFELTSTGDILTQEVIRAGISAGFLQRYMDGLLPAWLLWQMLPQNTAGAEPEEESWPEVIPLE